MRFKEIIGEEAFRELNKLVKENIDLRNMKDTDDLRVRQDALNLLLSWIGRIYEMTEVQKKKLNEDEVDLSKMFVIKD